MNRRRFLRTATGVFVPACFGILRASGQLPVIPVGNFKQAGSSQPSPIAWWKFDDGSGTSAADSSGNGHTGTLVDDGNGLPTWIAGHINGAIQTNNSHIDVSSSAFNLASATSPISVACWIKMATGAGANSVIYSARNTTPGNALMYFCVGNNALGGAGSGKLSVDVRDDSSGGLTEVTAATAVNTGNWVHVCFTRNSSKLITIYVNGVSDGSGSDTMGTSLTVTANWIGKDSGNSGFQSNVTCGEDDYRIYNVALTQPQVAFLAAM